MRVNKGPKLVAANEPVMKGIAAFVATAKTRVMNRLSSMILKRALSCFLARLVATIKDPTIIRTLTRRTRKYRKDKVPKFIA